MAKIEIIGTTHITIDGGEPVAIKDLIHAFCGLVDGNETCVLRSMYGGVFDAEKAKNMYDQLKPVYLED